MQKHKGLLFFIWGSVASLILMLIVLLFVGQTIRSRGRLSVYGQVPDFSFVNQDGLPFGLSDMKGKIAVVDFIYTSCNEECPLMSSKMTELYTLFAKDGNVIFVSISVDPDRDSLRVLQEYAVNHGVSDDRWVFLWHPIEEIASLSEKGFLLSASDLPEGHSNRFILVDQNGQIRGYYDGTSDESMKLLEQNIHQLLNKTR